MTNYYVSPIGIDSNTGLSEAQAWRTIGNAAKSLSVVSAGDTVHVLPGTYNEAVTISKSGTTDQRIIFKGENYPIVNTTGTGFKINGDYITITGFNITNAYIGIWLFGNEAGAKHVNVSYNLITSPGSIMTVGIYLWGGSNNSIIEYNTVNTECFAIYLRGELYYGSVSYNTIYSNNVGCEPLYFWGAGKKKYMNFVGNTIRGGRNGFGGGSMENCYIANNNISGHSHNAMNLHSTQNSLIENNWVGAANPLFVREANAFFSATEGYLWFNNILRNNTVEGSTGNGYVAYNSKDSVLENFNVINHQGQGLAFITGFSSTGQNEAGNWTIKNTTLQANSFCAIQMDGIWGNYYFTNLNVSYNNYAWAAYGSYNGNAPFTAHVLNSNGVSIYYSSSAVGSEFRFYYPLDVKVIDLNGNPISGATVIIANNIDSNYPSINYKFENKTSFTTGTNGHTSLPSDEENSIAIMDFRRTISTTNYMTYTITAERLGYTNSTTVDPDSSWYRSNPNTYQNTITIQLPVEITNGAVIGKVTDTSGNPIKDVSIDINGTIVLTDTNGDYGLGDLLPGTYNMLISKTGYISTTDEFIIITNEVITKNFILLLECPIPICEFTLTQL